MATILTPRKTVHTLLTMFQRQRMEFTGFKQQMVRKKSVKLRVILTYIAQTFVIVPSSKLSSVKS